MALLLAADFAFGRDFALPAGRLAAVRAGLRRAVEAWGFDVRDLDFFPTRALSARAAVLLPD